MLVDAHQLVHKLNRDRVLRITTSTGNKQSQTPKFGDTPPTLLIQAV
jgi:hypothetical protein